MKKSTFKIRRKIIGAFIFCALSVLIFAVLSFQAHREIGRRLEFVQVADDLVNNLLEMRRFEKNYLLYNERSSIAQALFHANRVEGLYLTHIQEFLRVMRGRGGRQFPEVLNRYREALSRMELKVTHGDAGTTGLSLGQLESLLRDRGQELLDTASLWVREERAKINRLFLRAVTLFVVSIVVFLILGTGMAFYLSRLLVNPLVMMQRAMLKIAEGDFTPIPESECRSEEFRPIFRAFNRMTDELEKRQEQLIQSRKIAAIGTLTSGVAHELNNPINNISITAETLLDDFHDLSDAEKIQLIRDIFTQSDRASEVVRHLLDFSRSESPGFEPLSIAEVIDETVRLVQNQVSLSHTRLHLGIPENLPSVLGNKSNLEQVFLNLFLNAIQAMEDGGTLSVSAQCVSNGYLKVDVSDTGHGIPQEDLARIFDPFFTTKEVGKGTGLGLSVTYGIIKKHNGRIEVASEVGNGTTFSVFLPTSEED